MIDRNEVKVTDTIACEICMTEIPDSVNQNPEADEYVSNYCGLECYQLWRDKQTENVAKSDAKNDAKSATVGAMED